MSTRTGCRRSCGRAVPESLPETRVLCVAGARANTPWRARVPSRLAAARCRRRRMAGSAPAKARSSQTTRTSSGSPRVPAQNVRCGGKLGAAAAGQALRAACHRTRSTIRVRQTRGRPAAGCGSIASIVAARRTDRACRTSAWLDGAYRLPSSPSIDAGSIDPVHQDRRRGDADERPYASALAQDRGATAWAGVPCA